MWFTQNWLLKRGFEIVYSPGTLKIFKFEARVVCRYLAFPVGNISFTFWCMGCSLGWESRGQVIRHLITSSRLVTLFNESLALELHSTTIIQFLQSWSNFGQWTQCNALVESEIKSLPFKGSKDKSCAALHEDTTSGWKLPPPDCRSSFCRSTTTSGTLRPAQPSRYIISFVYP